MQVGARTRASRMLDLLETLVFGGQALKQAEGFSTRGSLNRRCDRKESVDVYVSFQVAGQLVECF